MAADTVRLRVLGPVELVVHGPAAAPLAAKPRTLLALLMLQMNQVSERDWLIDQLWAGNPPPSARATLRAYVYQLRNALSRFDSGMALHGRSGGYELKAAAEAATVSAMPTTSSAATTGPWPTSVPPWTCTGRSAASAERPW